MRSTRNSRFVCTAAVSTGCPKIVSPYALRADDAPRYGGSVRWDSSPERAAEFPESFSQIFKYAGSVRPESALFIREGSRGIVSESAGLGSEWSGSGCVICRHSFGWAGHIVFDPVSEPRSGFDRKGNGALPELFLRDPFGEIRIVSYGKVQEDCFKSGGAFGQLESCHVISDVGHRSFRGFLVPATVRIHTATGLHSVPFWGRMSVPRLRNPDSLAQQVRATGVAPRSAYSSSSYNSSISPSSSRRSFLVGRPVPRSRNTNTVSRGALSLSSSSCGVMLRQ